MSEGEKKLAQFLFVAPNNPSYKQKLLPVGKRPPEYIQFVNGVYRTDDENVAERIRDVLRAVPRVAEYFHEVDRAAAERVSREFQAKFGSRQAAAKGALFSDHMTGKLAQMTLEDRDAQMLRDGAKPEDIAKMREEMAADGLLTTHDAKGEPIVRNDDLLPEGSTLKQVEDQGATAGAPPASGEQGSDTPNTPSPEALATEPKLPTGAKPVSTGADMGALFKK